MLRKLYINNEETIVFNYDVKGNLQSDENNSIELRRYEYQYNDNNQLIEKIDFTKYFTDADTLSGWEEVDGYKYEYNEIGKLVREIF